MGKQNEANQVAEIVEAKADMVFVEEKDSMEEMRLVSEIHIITEELKQTVLFNSIEIGKRLTKAKELVKHGKWSEWLENRVNYSQRTANNFMKIYKEYGESGIAEKSQSIANLSYTQALALLDAPKSEREKIAEDAKDKTIKELKEEIKKRKQEIEEEQNSTKEALEEIRQKHENELNIRDTRIEELVKDQSVSEKKLKELEKKQQEALKAKDVEAQEKIAKATQAEKEKLKKSEEEITTLKKEKARLEAKKQEEIDLAVKSAKELSKAEISRKDKEIADFKARLDKSVEDHKREIDNAKKKLEEEKEKNSTVATLAKCQYAVDEIFDGYAKVADIIMGFADVDRVTAKRIYDEVKKGIGDLNKKIEKKILS